MAMPVAGRLTDKLGAGRVVPVGLTITLLGTLAYAEVGADTPYSVLAVALWVRGVGLGATMMPALAAGLASLRPSDVPRATTLQQIVQRVGGSIGTALFAVYLARQIDTALPSAGHSTNLSALSSVPPSALEQAAGPLSHAFGQTFWLALALTAVVYVPALLLPRRRDAQLAAAEAGKT
jgi:MFS family permease